ncbi:transthyretin-like [Anguilla anguilla]|uniref:transthyretin-like n=1 Tax=Anguilla anguilla TaxID=7936 RepID=UPI0015B33324|nr:transthyretin-like [Anguilla anguilla]
MTPVAVFVILAAAIFHIEAAPVEKGGHGDAYPNCPLMVKVLDAVQGTPAFEVKVTVSRQETAGSWTKVTSGVTGLAGEVMDLIKEEDFTAGIYKVAFDTKAYWKAKGITPFHEMADVVFTAHADGHRHYTVAILLSPFSYTATAVVANVHN